VGIDLGTPVVEAVGSEAKSRFTGKLPKVTVEIRGASPRAEADVKKAWAEVRHRTE
jgi:arylsulfatase